MSTLIGFNGSGSAAIAIHCLQRIDAHETVAPVVARHWGKCGAGRC